MLPLHHKTLLCWEVLVPIYTTTYLMEGLSEGWRANDRSRLAALCLAEEEDTLHWLVRWLGRAREFAMSEITAYEVFEIFTYICLHNDPSSLEGQIVSKFFGYSMFLVVPTS